MIGQVKLWKYLPTALNHFNSCSQLPRICTVPVTENNPSWQEADTTTVPFHCTDQFQQISLGSVLSTIGQGNVTNNPQNKKRIGETSPRFRHQRQCPHTSSPHHYSHTVNLQTLGFLERLKIQARLSKFHHKVTCSNVQVKSFQTNKKVHIQKFLHTFVFTGSPIYFC